VFFALGLAADRVGLDHLDTLLFLTSGLLPVVLQTVSTGEDGFDYEITHGERARFVVSMLRWSVTPWGILTQVLQIVGNFVPYLRYRGALPGRERHRPAVELAAPFDGEWTVINGGVTESTSHSWGLVAQRYAYDFLITDDDGSTHEGSGEHLEDYYAFGEPIRTPAAGTVVKVEESLRDYPNPGTGWTEWRTWQIAGNHVLIEHDTGEYSLLAHLQEDSVPVDPGDRVTRGDVIGACGNSGNSSEPHLHYQLQDHGSFWLAAGLVPQFSGVTLDRDDDRRTTHEVYDSLDDHDPDDVRTLWAGDHVSPR